MQVDMDTWMNGYMVLMFAMLAVMLVWKREMSARARRREVLYGSAHKEEVREADETDFWQVGEEASLRLVCRGDDGLERHRRVLHSS